MRTVKARGPAKGFLICLLLVGLVHAMDPLEELRAPASDYDKSKSLGTAATRLVDVILSDDGMRYALRSAQVRGMEASRVKGYVNSALKSLSNGKKPGRQQLGRVLESLPIAKKSIDDSYRRSLVKLLNKQDPTREDFIEAVNSLIYLANRFGKSSDVVLACGQCVGDGLYQKGFKFTLEVMGDSNSRRVLKSLSKDPEKLRATIKKDLRNNNWGRLPSSTRLLAPEEERALGLFMGLAESGSSSQKKLIDSVIAISTHPKTKKTNLMDSENPHKLWKLFSDNLNDDEAERWARALKEINDDAVRRGESNKKEAFYRFLAKKAKDDPSLSDELEIIKKKKCFFQ